MIRGGHKRHYAKCLGALPPARQTLHEIYALEHQADNRNVLAHCGLHPYHTPTLYHLQKQCFVPALKHKRWDAIKHEA